MRAEVPGAALSEATEVEAAEADDEAVAGGSEAWEVLEDIVDVEDLSPAPPPLSGMLRLPLPSAADSPAFVAALFWCAESSFWYWLNCGTTSMFLRI